MPATQEGLPAIRQLISEGINVNVTLLFGLPRYREVAEAYLAGLEERAAQGLHLNVASVASFFLSRIDVLLDPQLEKMAQAGGPLAAAAASLIGRGGHRQRQGGLYHLSANLRQPNVSRPWLAKGARTQRLLWASTSTKNPAYPDVNTWSPSSARTPSTPCPWRP